MKFKDREYLHAKIGANPEQPKPIDRASMPSSIQAFSTTA
jgi:hypothetical protein